MGLLSKVFWLAVLIICIGVTIAIAAPDSVLASPFRGAAIKTLEITLSLTAAFHDARTVAASNEYVSMLNIVKTMQVTENVPKLPIVDTPTNDMTIFPSNEHPLYPNYIKNVKTEFRYTINSDGALVLDTDEAAIDPMSAGIQDKLTHLKNSENPGNLTAVK